MFKRKIYEKLLNWKKTKIHHNTAILIEGARRIGKSTLVEEFAKNEYDDYLWFDFSIESDEVKNEFEKNISNLDTFYMNIFLLKNKSLKSRNSLIVFDEVQLFPKARQAIKHLVKDDRFDNIETGSLIGIKENVKGILLPSEEHIEKMYPMDFEEFLWATNDEITINIIKKAIAEKKALDDSIHRKVIEKFRTYMCVGGMPQAIDVFINEKNYSEVDKIKKDILVLYENDIRKKNSINNSKSSLIFKSLASQIANYKSHFKYSIIKKSARAQHYIEAMDFLEESMIVNIARNILEPELEITTSIDYSDIKMFMGDTGLLITKAINDNNEYGNDLYKRIIFDKDSANLGSIYENVVAQILKSKNIDLFFNTYKYLDKNKKESKEKKYEIDFILKNNKHIIPIEVKSSAFRNHKSLDNFYKKFNLKKDKRFVVYTKNYKIEDDIIYLPVYMLPFDFLNI